MLKSELFFIKTSFLLLFIMMAMNTSHAQENPIKQHRWKQRVILVFSPQDQPEAGHALIAVEPTLLHGFILKGKRQVCLA
jgi:hypothetical protein